jgi:hypothetical protein
MRHLRYTPVALVLLLASVPVVRAQAPAKVSGHWEGSVQLPAMEVPIEVDVDTNAKGDLFGTFSQPAQKVRGLPLTSAAIDGRTVTFVLRSGSKFSGTLDAEGKTISGDLASVTIGSTVPVVLTRTGEARFDPLPKNAAVTKQMEGTWTGTIEVDSGYRVKLTIANQPDGTSTATLVSIDEGGLEMPVGITQNGSTLIVDIKMLTASFSGVLNAAGTELVGTYKTAQGADAPLTLRRASSDAKK